MTKTLKYFGAVMLSASTAFWIANAHAEDIKIGVAQVLEGPAAYYGDASWKGIQVAAKIINDSGGINGKKLVFSLQDDQGKPAPAVAVVRKLEQEGVLAIIGPTRTVTAIAAAPVVNQLGVPLIPQNSGGKWPIEPGKWVFKVAMPVYQQGPLMHAIKEKLKAKTIAIMYDLDDEASVSAFEDMKAQAEKEGVKIVATEGHRTSDIDMAPQITRIKNAKPDVFYYASKAETGGLIVRTARERGITVPIAAWPGVGGFQKVAGKDANGVISQTPFDPTSDDPIVQRFGKAYRDMFGKDAKLDQYHAYGHDAILMLADALRRAGDGVDRETLRDALASTKDLKAATGILSWDGSEPVRGAAAIVEWTDGRWLTYQ